MFLLLQAYLLHFRLPPEKAIREGGKILHQPRDSLQGSEINLGNKNKLFYTYWTFKLSWTFTLIDNTESH